MDELECMRTIDENLQAMPDDPIRARVVSWIAAKYLGLSLANSGSAKSVSGAPNISPVDGIGKDGQIAGIAKLSQTGEVQLTVRDFKARSTNEAAIRLVHVLIWVSGKLTGRTSVSSKHVIVPWLRKYRCYDGNTRGAIAKDKGLVREGDELSLDFHAEKLAEKFVEEILDPAVEGKWRPGTTRRRAPKTNGEIDAERL